MLAKNMSVSLMMPHEDFKEEVEEIRRVRRRKILNDYGEEENDTEGNGLENVDFIAFKRRGRKSPKRALENRDRIKFMPSRNEENEDEEEKDENCERLITITLALSSCTCTSTKHECQIAMRRSVRRETISIMNYVSALYENAFNPNIEIVVKEIGYTNKGSY